MPHVCHMLKGGVYKAVQFKTDRPSSVVGRQCRGFTLTELLVALMVGAIVLGAAATMADAMANGKAATERMTRSAAYLAQVQMRLADLVMRAVSIDTISGGVELTYGDGSTAQLYTDDTRRMVINNNGVFSYIQDPAQDNVQIGRTGQDRVVIAFDLLENGQAQTYRMTATRRGGM